MEKQRLEGRGLHIHALNETAVQPQPPAVGRGGRPHVAMSAGSFRKARNPDLFLVQITAR